ncbi:unnamed protein product [Leptosia nina]|uniref:U3 small nucleolar ribonucleoprotein protein MPP10 n=1 Tax=Leptosia nina TaxID=320188 RepID=A0AAV1JBA5_9NEOP
MQQLEEVIDKFSDLTAKPVNYLTVQNDIRDNIKDLVKTLYDFTKSQETKNKKKNKLKGIALPKMIVDEFDEEQIWQQIELQNTECWDHLIWEVANCISNKNDLKFPMEIVAEENEVTHETSYETEEENSSSETNIAPISKKSIVKSSTKPHKSSIVDDKFFKLQDMEQFLISEEKMEEKGKGRDEDEESIDLFEDIDDEDSEGDQDMMYKDFFNDEGNDELIEENGREVEDTADLEQNYFDNELNLPGSCEEPQDSKSNKTDKKVRFADLQPDSESESDSDDSIVEMQDKDVVKDEKKSEFEQRQQRLKQQIARLEEKTLKEAPWQLKGEVDATKRPQNSLLEEVVDFDLTTRPAPIITEQTTITLEGLIRQRIKDKAWDDVEKKEKPIDDQLLFKKPEILDHSKSKLSLAQVYEAEYLKQKQAMSGEKLDEEEPESHKDVRESMSKLFSKLDALCHYHYTPKPPQAEVKIVSNTPAISMEEVAPLATSDAALLAPEEVKKKQKGDLMSKEERTQTDKNRERRKKKKMQQKKGHVQKVTDNRNTKKGVEANDKSLKTSKAFFQQLNDEAKSLIKKKRK